MNDLIEQALNSISIKNFYITKGTYAGECVVYNYISAPSFYADNTKKGEEYTILINLYAKTGIEAKKALVIKTLNAFGIKGGRAQQPFKEKETDTLYNIAISFNGFMRIS